MTSWECPTNLLHTLYPIVRVAEAIHFEILPREPNPGNGNGS